MSAEVANRYLQGRESLAIAIARGQVRCRGESRAALAYLPAARLHLRAVPAGDRGRLSGSRRGLKTAQNGCLTPH